MKRAAIVGAQAGQTRADHRVPDSVRHAVPHESKGKEAGYGLGSKEAISSLRTAMNSHVMTELCRRTERMERTVSIEKKQQGLADLHEPEKVVLRMARKPPCPRSYCIKGPRNFMI